MERRPLDLVLSALLLPATAALVLSALTFTHHAYTGVTVRNARIAAIEPGSPGWRARLQPGDELLPAPGSGAHDPLEPNPLRDAHPGRPLLVERQRLGRSEPVWLVPEAMPGRERRSGAILFAVASVFVLLGGWVWSERRDQLTRIFLLLCLAFAGMLTPQPFFDSREWQTAYELGYLGAQLYVPVLFAHFFALFPEPRPRPRVMAWIRAGYGIATAMFLAIVAVVAESYVGSGAWTRALSALGAPELALFAAGMLGGLALFAASFLYAPSSDARRRLRVAFVGTLLGAAPFAAAVAWRNLSPGIPLPGERLAVMFTVAVPASFAWAITVHRVFDIRVALRAIVVLALAGALAFTTYAAGEWLASHWWPALGEGVCGASLAFLALVASLAGPARPWLGALGARVVPIAGEVPLAAWSPSAAAARSGDAEVLLGEACEAVRRSLRLAGCAAVRFGPCEARIAAQSGARLLPALGRSFIEVLQRAAGVREVGELGLAHEDRDTLELAGVHWVVPIPGAPASAALLLGRRLGGPWLDRHEAGDLDQLTHHLAVALENADLKHQALGRVAFEREMAEAHTVQAHRLPRRTPVYPTLDCAAATLSTESVGGDYYDFIEMAPRDFALAVGDAAGHGVPAAIVLAGVQSRFRDEAQRARHPGELLEALNRDLVALDQPDRFMGLLCARIDVGAGLFRFANAGLTPPLVRRADGRIEELTDSGLLLGVSPEARYGVSAVELAAGDVAVVYTDGLSEACRDGRMFGTEGISAVLAAHAHRRAADILDELLAAAREWASPLLDDLTIVVLKQLARPRAREAGAEKTLKLAARTDDIGV